MRKAMLLLIGLCCLEATQAWAAGYYALCVGKANAIEGVCDLGKTHYPHLSELVVEEDLALSALKRSPEIRNELQAAGKAYDPRSGWFFKRH